MNEQMNVLIAIAAMATYEKRGLSCALKYLMRNGWTRDGAVELINRYDNYKAFIDDFTQLP